MKFEKNTAVTILRWKPDVGHSTMKVWTENVLPPSWGLIGGGSTIGHALDAADEGIYWARGHEDEVGKALIVARALR